MARHEMRTQEEFVTRREEVRRYLQQDKSYPSESKGGAVDIRDMEPAHAYRAYRSLRMMFFPEWPEVKHSYLIAALIERAMEGDVALKRKGESARHTLTIEDVFDALQKVNDTVVANGKPLHPITRARIVHTHLTLKETHG